SGRRRIPRGQAAHRLHRRILPAAYCAPAAARPGRGGRTRGVAAHHVAALDFRSGGGEWRERMAALRKGGPVAMKLELTIDGVQGRIEILSPGPGCRFRLDDGPERAANVEVAEPCVYSVLLDGR